MAKMELNLEAVSTSSNFSVLESGMYPVSITSTEIAKTASGGHMLNVVMTVKEGDSEGKSIINRMNIVNKNPDTVKWALRDLKTIMTVGGHSNPNFLADSDELLGLVFNVSLEKKGQMKDGQPVCNDKGEQYMENKFNGFFKASAAPVVSAPAKEAVQAEAQTQTAKPAAQTAAPAAQGAFPWS